MSETKYTVGQELKFDGSKDPDQFFRTSVTRVRVERTEGGTARQNYFVRRIDGDGDYATQWVREGALSALDTPEASDETKDLIAEVNRLKAMLETVRKQHAEDIDLIGERLLKEADDRGWCGDYDEVVERLNQRLNKELPLREREFEVTITFSQTITVNARDEEAAEELARELSEYMDPNYLTEDDITVDEA